MAPGGDSDIEIVRIAKLDRPPVGRGTDREWWEAELEADGSRHTIMLWATGADAPSVTEDTIRQELERQAAFHAELDSLYAASPIQLRPGSA
jgi:hypothetical protein